MPKIAQTKHAITGWSHQSNKHFVLNVISFISEQLQNNTFNLAMSITSNRVITKK